MPLATPPWTLDLLGPVRLCRDGEPVEVGSPQRLALLAVLALARGYPTGLLTLIDAVWGADRPPRADVAVRAHVSVLRRMLEPGRPRRSPGRVLVTEGQGYSLDPAAFSVDVWRFRRLAGRGRDLLDQGDPAAAGALREALSFWRGDALSGLPGPSAVLSRGLLGEERLTTWEDLIDAELHDPDHTPSRSTLATLQRVLADHPHRERLHALHVRLHLHAGRRSDALLAFARARDRLVRDLGIEPGAELQEAHRCVLTTVAPRPVGTIDRVGVSVAPHTRSEVPIAFPDDLVRRDPVGPLLVGRREELRGLTDLLRAQPHAEVRTLHVRGMPGVGSCALVLAAAEAVRDGFPGGVLALGCRARPEDRRAAVHGLGPGPSLVLAPGTETPEDVHRLWGELAGRPGGDGGPVTVVLSGTHRLPDIDAERVELGPLADGEALALFLRELGDGARGADPQVLRGLVALHAGVPQLLVAGARALAEHPENPISGWLDAVTATGSGSLLRRALDRYLADHLAVLRPEEADVLRATGVHPWGPLSAAAVAALLARDAVEVDRALAALHDRGLLDPGVRAGEYEVPFVVWNHARLAGEEDDPPEQRRARADRLLGHFKALLRVSLDERGRGGRGDWFARHEPTLRVLLHCWGDRPAAPELRSLLAEATSLRVRPPPGHAGPRVPPPA